MEAVQVSRDQEGMRALCNLLESVKYPELLILAMTLNRSYDELLEEIRQ